MVWEGPVIWGLGKSWQMTRDCIWHRQGWSDQAVALDEEHKLDLTDWGHDGMMGRWHG